LAPGESTVVELIFQTKNYKTKVSKYATIYSNDPNEPTTKIQLSSIVDPIADSTLPFILRPEMASLSRDSKKARIELENKGAAKFLVQPVGDLLEGLSLDIKNDDPKPGQKSELRFEWAADFQKENLERSVTFLVTGDGGEIARFSVPVIIQGTDPAPKVTSKPPQPARGKTAKTSSVRTPARRSTAGQEPTTVNPAVKSGDLTPAQAQDKQPAEEEKAAPAQEQTPDSKDDQ
jgi:hypothetical protein